jgi:hypothetical protein
MSWCKIKYNSLKEYFSSQDTQQNLTVTISFISDAFKVVMASLLCLFVPQQCQTLKNNSDIFNTAISNDIVLLSMPSILAISNTINGTAVVSHMCTFNENFVNLIDYNTFVLAFNFITLGYFIYLYYIELKRETWLINNFDYDKEKTDENILTLKDTFPEVMDNLQKHNYKYMLTYKYLFILYIINFVSSAVLVLYFYYYDYRTITTLITNVALCSNKIRIGRNISRKSYEKEYAYSYYNSKNLSFNVIDHRYLKDEDKMLSENNFNKNDKKEENVHKHLYSIKKYINTL